MQTIGPTSVGNIYFSPLGRPCELGESDGLPGISSRVSLYSIALGLGKQGHSRLVYKHWVRNRRAGIAKESKGGAGNRRAGIS